MESTFGPQPLGVLLLAMEPGSCSGTLAAPVQMDKQGMSGRDTIGTDLNKELNHVTKATLGYSCLHPAEQISHLHESTSSCYPGKRSIKRCFAFI